MFFLSFFVVDDAVGRGEHDVAELTRWQQVCRPLVDLELFIYLSDRPEPYRQTYQRLFLPHGAE